MKKILLSVVVLAAFGTASKAQSSATGTATATAIIVAPITITNAANMHFGHIVASGTSGTVELTPAATPTRNITGGVTLVASSATASAASFDVTGTSGYTFNITLPSSAVTLTHSAGSAGPTGGTMTINTFTTDKSLTSNTITSSAFNFKVGATLAIAASQVPGTYTTLTPFNVVVAYN
ncbi:MAG: hypothetical protein JWQ96_126 [Segetibacter sp.]|nr:hypothetical protein [Segetibacter sp.]